MNTALFYRDKPVFGFDIGHESIKIMQIDRTDKKDVVVGYGHTSFDPRAINRGVIVDPESLAKSVYSLITKQVVGTIDTRRVAVSIPNSVTFNRVLELPPMEKGDIGEAVRTEAEQYIPMQIEDLYLDYEIAHVAPDGKLEVLVVAVPRKIIDSYVTLFELLGLEVAIMQTNIDAVAQIVNHAERGGIPTLIIDFGAMASDLAIYDRTIRVTGTVPFGGETVSDAIAKSLKVTPRQAYTIKTRYGLDPGKKQKEIMSALDPSLKNMSTEIKKIVRFYEERGIKGRKLEQIILVGGGANLPGLSAYLTDKHRIPTRLCDPWQNISFGKLQPPHPLETTTYTTAAGLSLVDLKGAYK